MEPTKKPKTKTKPKSSSSTSGWIILLLLILFALGVTALILSIIAISNSNNKIDEDNLIFTEVNATLMRDTCINGTVLQDNTGSSIIKLYWSKVGKVVTLRYPIIIIPNITFGNCSIICLNIKDSDRIPFILPDIYSSSVTLGSTLIQTPTPYNRIGDRVAIELGTDGQGFFFIVAVGTDELVTSEGVLLIRGGLVFYETTEDAMILSEIDGKKEFQNFIQTFNQGQMYN